MTVVGTFLTYNTTSPLKWRYVNSSEAEVLILMFFLNTPVFLEMKVAEMEAVAPGSIAPFGYCTFVQPQEPLASSMVMASAVSLVNSNSRFLLTPAFTSPRSREVVFQDNGLTAATAATAIPSMMMNVTFFI